MTVNRTTLLDLPLPVTGTETTTWGDITNYGLTEYLDIAIAGSLSLTTDADVNLATTEGNSSGTNITSTTAQYMVLNCTGARTLTRNINAPKQSKLYVVINATTGGFSVVLRGGPTSPTTGVTVTNGTQVLCAWNGSDFVVVGAVGNVTASGNNAFTGANTFYNATGQTFAPASTNDGIIVLGRAGGSSSYRVTLSPTTLSASRTLTLPDATGTVLTTAAAVTVAQGGTGATTLTANNVILGNGTSAVQFVAPGSNGNVLTSNGTTWTSAAAGATLSGQTDSGSPYETSLGYQAGNVSTGVNNTFVGYQAGLVNSTGTRNTAVGHSSLYTNTTGANNAALGDTALYSNTSGGNNTAIGKSALATNTTGSFNIALGGQALQFNTTANFNTALGYNALGSNTTASNNTAVGYGALDTNTTGYYNSAVGVDALGVNTTGSFNAAFGGFALISNTTANYNTAFGYASLYANTTGYENTAVGYQALDANTTGVYNVAVGTNALGANTTGQFNSAFGSQALQYSVTGSSNAAFGMSALSSNTGSFNCGFGSNTLNANSGSSNCAFGYQSLYQNTSGNTNTALGVTSLYANTTGSNNVALGNSALYTNTTASYNVAIGPQSLRLNSVGEYNTAIGAFALYSTTGSSNIGIGNSAGFTLTSGSNNIIIGTSASASSTTVSNEVTLGDTSITSTRLRGMVQLNAAMFEQATVSATAATGTINYDTRTQSVLYYTSNASGNWTLNIRGASGVSLDSIMSTGQSITVAFLVTNGATAYYQSAFQVDSASVTPKWQGGTAPTAGNASSIDAYVITVIKTGSATFTALASQTKFA